MPLRQASMPVGRIACDVAALGGWKELRAATENVSAEQRNLRVGSTLTALSSPRGKNIPISFFRKT
jgi:hypothetical protein